MDSDISPSNLAAFGLPTQFSSTKRAYKSNFCQKPKTFSTEACDHFNKKYKIIGSDFTLPETDSWFVEPKWKIDKFQNLKEKLNNVKSHLNSVELKAWHQHTNFVNRSAKVISYVKRFIKPQLTTQAWCKFHEIVYSYNLISFRQKSLTSVHLCEAPGAFIASLNHYLKSHQPFVQWDWIANTLNPHYEGNSFNEMINDDRLILASLDRWYFGPEGVGNILAADFADHFTQHVKQQAVAEVLLVTADGSFDCQGNPGDQEILVSTLHYREVHLALSILQNGGSFVLKLFTIFEAETICLVYILCCLFQQVHLFKPVSSKEGNSEIYVICLGFDRSKAETSRVASKLSRAFDPKLEKRMLFGLESIPSEFIAMLYQGVLKFTHWQMDAIERNLSLYEENIRSSPAECARLDKLQVEIAEMYLHKYKLRPLQETLYVIDLCHTKDHFKHTLTCDGRIESGSYKERLAKENITRCQYVMEELKQIDTHCDRKPRIRWIEDLQELNIIDRISLIKGRPIRSLESSISVLPRLFKLLYEMRREVKDRNLDIRENIEHEELNSRPVYSVLEDNGISKETVSILNFPTSCHLYSTDLTQSHVELLESLISTINQLADHESLLLINIPLLTQFSVAVVLLLAGSLFEKVGCIQIHDSSKAVHMQYALLLSNKLANEGVTNSLSSILSSCRETLTSSGGKKSVLTVLPVTLISEHPVLYRFLFEVNCCAVKDHIVYLMSSLAESLGPEGLELEPQ